MVDDERQAIVNKACPRQTLTWASSNAWILSYRPCARLAELFWSIYVHSMKLNMTIKSSTCHDHTMTAIGSRWQQSGIPMNLNSDAQPVIEAGPHIEYENLYRFVLSNIHLHRSSISISVNLVTNITWRLDPMSKLPSLNNDSKGLTQLKRRIAPKLYINRW